MDGIFDGQDELYHHAKFGEDHIMRAGCRCENVVFFFHAPSPVRCGFDGCIVRTSIALPFIGRFRRHFQCFFQKGSHLEMHYIVRILVARWRHNFRVIAVKNCEKSKKIGGSLCARLRRPVDI